MRIRIIIVVRFHDYYLQVGNVRRTDAGSAGFENVRGSPYVCNKLANPPSTIPDKTFIRHETPFHYNTAV